MIPYSVAVAASKSESHLLLRSNREAHRLRPKCRLFMDAGRALGGSGLSVHLAGNRRPLGGATESTPLISVLLASFLRELPGSLLGDHRVRKMNEAGGESDRVGIDLSPSGSRMDGPRTQG